MSGWRSDLPELSEERLYQRVVAEGNRRRRARQERRRRVVGVAAAAVVVAGLVGLLSKLDSDGGDDTAGGAASATTAAAAAETTAAGGDTTEGAGTTAGAAATTAAPTTTLVPGALTVEPLVVFESPDDLDRCGAARVTVTYRPATPLTEPLVTWQVGAATGTARPTEAGGVLRAEVGPFTPGTVAAPSPLVITVSGLDEQGRPVSASTRAELRPCASG